jgi:hypothetical protein
MIQSIDATMIVAEIRIVKAIEVLELRSGGFATPMLPSSIVD